MVNAENKVGGSDMQNDFAYHAAEGGIEKMASDLDIALKNAQATTAAKSAPWGVPGSAPTNRRYRESSGKTIR